MDDTNCVSLVLELCKSYLTSSGSHIPDSSLKKLVRKVLSTIFTFRNGRYDEENLLNNPYQLVRMEIFSHFLTDGFKNPDRRAQIDQCLVDLEEMYNEWNDDNFMSVLLFLYALSKASYCNKDPLPSNCAVMNDDGLYLDSDRYNDINWETFNKDSVSYQTHFDYPFHESPGTGLKLLTDYCLDVESSNDFANISNGKCKLWRFDLNRAVDPVLQDEGFVTPGSNFSEETSEKSDCNDLDTSALLSNEFNCDPQSLALGRLTWEQLGQCVLPSESLFAFESLESIIHLWKVWNAFRHLMVKSLPIGECITFEELKTDINHLLFGVASSSFYFNQITGTFHLRDALHLRTITPEMLLDFCEPFAEYGYYFHTLKNFAECRLKLPYGPVHRMFCHCLQQVLHIHQYCLLHIDWDSIRCLSQLEMVISPLKRKLSFLSKLCFIVKNEKSSAGKFPAGVQLLDYLYNNLSRMAKSDFRYILLHFFEGCCNTYLKIVAEWIFNGSFSNPENYEEFFIEIQREHEICHDWRRVSCIRVKEKQVPKFLEQVYKDIFVCGKSVNLLKIFAPRDILETVLPQCYPDVHCCFNKTQIDNYTQSWNQFQKDCSKNFKSNVKLADKLKKNHSPEFYEEIKAVRAKWFRQYEYNLNRRSHNSSLVKSTLEIGQSFADTSPNLKNVEDGIENVIEVKSQLSENVDPSVQPNKAASPVDPENYLTSSVEDGSEKLIDEKEKQSDTFSSPDHVPVCKVNESGDCPAGDTSSAPVFNGNVGNFLATVDPKLRTRLTVTLPTPVHGGSGDAVPPVDSSVASSECEQNKLRSVSSEYQNRLNMITEQETNSTVPSIPLSGSAFDQNIHTSSSIDNKSAQNSFISDTADRINGASTPLSACAQNRLRVMSSAIQEGLSPAHRDGREEIVDSTPMTVCMRNKLKVMSSSIQESSNSANDNQSTINSTTSDISDKTIVASTPLSACARNKLRVMSSAIQEDPNLWRHDERKEVADSTPMTICMRNKLKAMSSSIQENSNPANEPEERKVTQSTPMTDCMKNKQRVMLSEYHQRLCNSVDETNQPEAPKPYELNEYEKNKLKVMSSEYHIRLGAIADQNELIEEKLMSKAPLKFTERVSNRKKMLASDYQDSLRLSSVDQGQVVNSTQDVVLSSENENENIPDEVEPESVSEDVETDDLITVVENLRDDSKSCEHELLIEEKMRPQKFENIFDLKNYIFHPEVLSSPMAEDIDKLKLVADSVKNVDTTTVLYYLTSSILVPLRIQSKLVNDAILRVFIEQERYLDHLIMLKNYVLLRKPEFSLLLTSTIFEMSEKVKKPFLLLNSYTLSSILQQSLLVSNSRKSIQLERKLSLVIEDMIPETLVLTDIRMLNCLSLTYSVKWPINVLITEPVIKKYSRVFRFLMQLQRASWTLKSDFKSLKNLKRGKSIQYTQIQLYRHSMTQVIRVLLEFIMRDALEKCWNDLVDHLTSTQINLDEMYMSHLKYINKIMQRCFLCDLSVSCHEAVLSLLTSVLKYHEALRAGNWQLNVEVNFLYHTNFKNIHTVFVEFQKHLEDVRTQLKLLVFRRQRRYFEPLLVELCSNSRNETHL